MKMRGSRLMSKVLADLTSPEILHMILEFLTIYVDMLEATC